MKTVVKIQELKSAARDLKEMKNKMVSIEECKLAGQIQKTIYNIEKEVSRLVDLLTF